MIKIILFFSFFNILYSQQIKFRNINVKNGLSQSQVNDIIQDSKGFMWFATEDGLNKYDGINIKIYQYNPEIKNSLSSSKINCLFEDKSHLLWIGTFDGGVSIYNYNNKTFINYKHIENKKNSLSSNNVTAIYQSKDGNIWIGTDKGLNKWLADTKEFKHYGKANGLESEKIKSLFEDHLGNFWIGTIGGGLYNFDVNNEKFIKVKNKLDKGIKPLYFKDINVIFEDSKNRLFVGTNYFLFTYKRNIEKFVIVPLDKKNEITTIKTITEDKKGNIWIGTEEKGIYIITNLNIKHISKLENNPNGLIANYITKILPANDGSIWIGTIKGISVFHSNFNRFEHYFYDPNDTNSLNNNIVLAFTEDKENNLWIGTYEGGINVYDKVKKKFIHYPTEKENNNYNAIISLYTDNEGKIWIGSWGKGINYYNPKTKKFSKPFNFNFNYSKNKTISSSTVLAINGDKNDNIWIGTYRGLDIYNQKTNTFSHYNTSNGLSDNVINCIYIDEEGNGWLGTSDGGLNYLNIKTDNVKIYKKNDDNSGLSANTVNCIYKDKNGVIWIGTKFGLNRFLLDKKIFYHYYETNGLPSNYILGILEDKQGKLWISTIKGLSRFDPMERDNSKKFKNYFEEDGLQSNEFNQGAYYKGKDGKLYFGGINGFNAFYPENITDNTHIPPVYITSFKIYNKELKTDSSILDKNNISISYKDKYITIEFIALDYVLPSKNLYSFKLTGPGISTEWSKPSTRRFASFSNLEGGKYKFQVIASNNDGIWNKKGRTLYLYVSPPFYKTSWFYTLSVLFIIISVLGIIKIRTQRIEKEKRILEQKVEERTKELESKNKEILSSIRYAKRIQEAILPIKKEIFKNLSNSFIIYRPKDIVSGDFYWYYNDGENQIIAAADCTGHGVPGAFMSMIGHTLLNQIVIENKIKEPDKILKELSIKIIKALKQDSPSAIETTDGMDIALCKINLKENLLYFAGAYRPLLIIHNDEITTIKGNKLPIGGAQINIKRDYTLSTIEIKKDMCIYLFSDGVIDQFGGPNHKKFTLKRFSSLLLENNKLNMQEQKEKIIYALEDWIKDEEQIDDILIIGIKF